MDEKEMARLVNANSKMSYTLGFVYGGLSEFVNTGNLTGTQHSQIMALLQLLHKNCNAIFYSPEPKCDHEHDGIRYAVLKQRSTDKQEYEYKCIKCGEAYTKDE